MAEFQEVIKQWGRMCKSLDKDCDKCPVEGNPCTYIVFGIDDLKYIEPKIMKWAAENPEPKYPSWEEYLCSIGFCSYNSLSEPVPEAIAKKLGIKPKGEA